MKKWFWSGAVLCAIGLALFGSPQSVELDPLKVASDTHRLLYENALVRVISAQVPAGKNEPKHSHPKSVTVYLADYTVEQKSFPEGRVTRSDRKVGTVSWSDAVVHEVRNVGRTPSHAIRIELK
ncbi:MAG: hypothetical protein ACRD96_18810 [Bryobacteraceae bacterium]